MGKKKDDWWFVTVVLLTALGAFLGETTALLILWCVCKHPALSACSATAAASAIVGARVALRVAHPARLLVN